MGVLLAFGLVLVFAFALSWIWIIFGMKVKTPESVMTTSFVFLMPLTFASNIFVGLETMPPWLQAVVRHNPVTHLANASRGLMHGTGRRRPTSSGCWSPPPSSSLVAAPDRPAHVPPGALSRSRRRRRSLRRVRLEASAHHHGTGDALLALVKRRLVRGDRHQEPAVDQRGDARQRLPRRVQSREEREVGLLEVAS